MGRGGGFLDVRWLFAALFLVGLSVVYAAISQPAAPRRAPSSDLAPRNDTAPIATRNQAGATPTESAPLPVVPLDDARGVIARIIAQLEARGLVIGLHVIDADTGKPLVAHHAATPLVPASNVKLIGTATALKILGPTYRFKTRFLTDGTLDTGGTLAGDLVVVGGGDPLLTTENLAALALRLRARGLTRVTGDLLADDSWFATSGPGPGWEQDDTDNYYQAPLSALSVQFNAVWVYVLPGALGRPPRVVTIPDSSYLTLDNQAVTSDHALTELTVGTPIDGERNAVKIEGHIHPAAGRRSFWLKIDNAPLYAAMTLKDTLARFGIKIDGRARVAAVPESAKQWATYRSPPLREVVTLINKISSNHAAEQIMLAAATETTGKPGTFAAAATLMQQTTAALIGPLGERMRLKNASGLGDVNQVAPEVFTALLLAARHDPDFGPEYVASLAIAAKDGTLRDYFDDWTPADRLRAKTGSLEQVIALSGYLTRRDGKRLIVSLIFNQCRGHNRLALKADHARILQLLAGAPD